ncbi:MAG: hypothetical protein U1G07_17955 [Verrucomicrobiota bacterium]
MTHRHRLLLLGALLLPLTTGSHAASDFYLREQRVKAPEMGEILTYVLVAGGEEYAFVPPFEWRIGSEAERRRLVLTSRDRSASILVSLQPPNAALGKEAEPEALRRQVLARFNGGRIMEEFACHTGSHNGRAFDVAWTGPGDVAMTSRLAFFATASGAIEFNLSTMAGRFRPSEKVLGSLLTSFQQRSGTGGTKPAS